MANLILASKREVKSGAMMWNVYRSEDNVRSDSFFFSEPLKALRYAFILRKRTGAVIPKGIYNKLMAEIKEGQQPASEEVGEAQDFSPAPIAKQYEQMKAKHADAVLLFRVGDFYVSYGEDAKVVSDVCGLVLTTSDELWFKHVKGYTYTAFPAHSLDTYLPKLVRAGKRVAICDQLAEPKK